VKASRAGAGKGADMPIYVATSCVGGVLDSATALGTLESWGIEHAVAMPGLPTGRDWESQSTRWGDRLWLHHACLEDPQMPRWNLAAGDPEWRRRSVDAASKAIRRSADHGVMVYSLHAGHALELGLDEKGTPKGAARSREQALDRLAISLDRLANLADNLHVELLLENAAGRRTPTGRAASDLDAWSLALFQEPAEIERILSRVAAPKLGVLLDVAHLLLTCHARKWEPEPVLEELQPWVRAIALSGTDSLNDLHRLPKEDSTEVQLARRAGGLALPLIFEPHNVPKAELRAYMTELESSLAAGPKHHTVERK
jgi:hypothetical protein